MRPTRLLFAVLAGGLALPAQAADFAAFNRAYAQAQVIPALARLAAETTALAQAAAATCRAPDAAGLARIVDGFDKVDDAWMSAQQFRLGPLSQDQRAERFAYWPEKRNIVEKQLAALLAEADPAALAPAALAQASVAVQGLTALERLLFPAAAESLLAGDQPAFRCTAAAAIAANLAAIAGETRQGWEAALADPRQAAAPFAADPAEATTQLYSNLLTELQIVADQKVAAPLAASAAEARPKLAEQWRAGRSLRNIVLNLQAARRSMLDDAGFAALLPGPQFDGLKTRLAAAFDQAIVAATDVPLPLDRAVADAEGRKAVERLFVRLNQLRDIARQEMPPALGITLGFNELDGDGS